MRRLASLFAFILAAVPLYAQTNIARMNAGINAQTGTSYAMKCSDSLLLVTFSNALPVAVSLPSASTCGAGVVFSVRNLGAGSATITPSGGTIDGIASLTLTTGSGTDIFNNGVDYSTNGTGGGLTAPGGTVGQALINTGSGTGSWQDPNVSFTPVNLFSAVTANATHTSSNIKNPVYSQAGSLLLTFAGLTGVYTTCTIQLQAVDSLGNVINSGSAISVTPSNGTTSIIVPVNAASNPPTFAPFIAAVWACGAYGSAGTLSLDFAGQVSSPGHGTGATTIGQLVQPGQAIIAQITAQQGFAPSFDLIADAKILLPNGQIQDTRWEINPCNFTSSVAMSGFAVTQGGWLQTFNVDMNTAGIPWGSALLNLYIANSVGAATTTGCTSSLAIGQVGNSLGSWMTGSFLPTGFVGTTGNITHPWTVPGVQRSFQISNPAAGAEFSSTLGGSGASARTCITGASFFFATSATVATRTVSLRFTMGNASFVGSNVEQFYISPTDETASQNYTYSFAPSAIPQLKAIQGNTFITIPFTPGAICADSGTLVTIQSRTNNLQVGDQFTGVFFWTTQWHDND